MILPIIQQQHNVLVSFAGHSRFIHLEIENNSAAHEMAEHT